MTTTTDRRLIEDWLPIAETSIESIRERAAASALPPINWLHVWWARRPLAISRAAVAASLLSSDAESDSFYSIMGTHSDIISEQAQMDAAKAAGVRLKQGYSKKRAFTHNPTADELDWFQRNLAAPDPLVLDVTAGGGSIPFEAGRLGLRSHANDLNPVATLILRATCEWPQRYGRDLLSHYDSIRDRFQKRVAELLEDVYPAETLPPDLVEYNREYADEIRRGDTERAQRYVWSYLWARSIFCPNCKNSIPLSPNWRLDSRGKGLRLLPDEESGKCGFEIVETAAEQSAGTVSRAIATCPYPSCGATTPRGYISEEARSGRLGHQLYCVIIRDQWRPKIKSGRFSKRLKTRRNFRIARPDDLNTSEIQHRLEKLKPMWDADDVLPNEPIPEGNKTAEPHRYGKPLWKNLFSPRQQLAHGCCVQAFRELVDEDSAAGLLSETRKAAWCYIAFALDKLISTNSLLCRWHANRSVVAGTFDSHDFGMKWSYTEMAVTVEGLGLDWALNDLRDCISALADMSGNAKDSDGDRLVDASNEPAAVPSITTNEPADFMLSLDDASADAIVFDPPYYDNVSYAELSDFFYVWLKRTAGYVYPDWFTDYLTDKDNEAIASPARFRDDSNRRRGAGSVKARAYDDYVDRMRRMFAECRRVIKDDGIMTIMFTHKSTDAWDALTTGIIEAGFRISATWPVKTESDTSLNIRDRAAARSTILIACRPKTAENSASASWESVERQVSERVKARLPELEGYDLKPLDIYLASFGPALEVISENWPIRRELANPERPDAPFEVTPNDALQVARREALDARRRRISERWANSPGDALTEFYILSQDNAGTAKLPFDEANLMARCVGLELSDYAGEIYAKSGDNITLLTGRDRFEKGVISPAAPTSRAIDRAHTAIALTANADANAAIRWCAMQGFAEDAAFKATLEALLRIMKPSDPDSEPARTLWSEMYGERPPEPEGAQPEMQLPMEKANE